MGTRKLLTEVSSGNEAAINHFYEKWYISLYKRGSFSFTNLGEDGWHEAAQETMLTTFKCVERITGTTDKEVECWIWKTWTRRSISLHRKNLRRKREVELLLGEAKAGKKATRWVEEVGLRHFTFKKWRDQLTEEQKRLVNLRFYQGLNNKQIAASEGKSEAWVSKIIKKALEQFKEQNPEDED